MRFFWKHLRLRGENSRSSMLFLPGMETPPLARRKQGSVAADNGHGGNTSACAEKTNSIVSPKANARKHLRLRGENCHDFDGHGPDLETPPLARRKRQGSGSIRTARQKHLRLRGENKYFKRQTSRLLETPPLARRKRSILQTKRYGGGNTSACAEKTILSNKRIRTDEKHLRLRGENASSMHNLI